jgi:putative membrane protein
LPLKEKPSALRAKKGCPLNLPRHNNGETNVELATNILIGLIAVLHVYILVLEMFLWDKPRGMKAFGNTQQAAAATKVLAANQGLYNGFLAAGLLVGLWMGRAGLDFKIFFLICVLVAGLYGAATASKKILFIQAIPAVIALAMQAYLIVAQVR